MVRESDRERERKGRKKGKVTKDFVEERQRERRNVERLHMYKFWKAVEELEKVKDINGERNL
jgi:hypothetical protein